MKITLHEVLEQTARSVVHRATIEDDGGLVRPVAVKIPLDSNRGLQQTRQQARALSVLKHRSIVAAEGLAELADGRKGLVMELVRGVTLPQADADQRPSVRASLEIAAELAGALDVAVRTSDPATGVAPIQHRELRPAEVMLTPEGSVKLLGFGRTADDLAAAAAATTVQGAASLGYSSPEALDGVDHPAADVYAVGVILYELLTGERFGKTSANLDRHGRKVAAASTRLVAIERIGPKLAGLFGQVMDGNPDKRPSPRAIENELRRLAEAAGGTTLRDWAERAITVPEGKPVPIAEPTPLPEPTSPLPTNEETTGGFAEEDDNEKIVMMSRKKQLERRHSLQGSDVADDTPRPRTHGSTRRGLVIGVAVGGVIAFVGVFFGAWYFLL